MTDPITPGHLLSAYRMGIFPMSDGREASEISWHRPLLRGVIPLDAQFHCPRRLARTALQGRFAVTSDRCFNDVIRLCAETPGREETWISDRIQKRYTLLHDLGHAHSIETWRGNELVGGLYGVMMGGAFFGESMFSLCTDASKIALLHLVAALRQAGFTLLDAQFPTAHLETFGCLTVPDGAYRLMLDRALAIEASWHQDVSLGRLREEITRLREGIMVRRGTEEK
ncbi:leucyl/phenylalanyl-tRNA--protein transferase [Asaia krungthepensis]|uniref:Leucyl/phenylalanyl-tRNA--protein transferase n=1 Tax=Asaia krungthepensis NRIC 0535 TaxID=1307925 RepID=A0ABQ0Q686_9PROT|nr:leucyl/phenylalanyl-tRNA--protein transferase [Asaia krungthepensis]GBQ93214.1 leucyl/phenylalanyl-tRNA--protein transferase [Asaia krungthepensis NRIC 0535]